MRGTLAGIAALVWLSLGGSALAQPPSVESLPPQGKVTSHLQKTEDERDRFEIGMAVPQGYFDWLGTFGYRRFMREGGPLEQSLMAELSGTAKDYLGEGALSVYYLFRPIKSYKEGWKLRPLIEAGPGLHLVAQMADIEGFDDSAFHTQAYLKTHLYGGFEFLFSQKLGLVVRGRVTLPEDHPLDYAQAAILLR